MVLASLIFDSIWHLKNKIKTHEIPMRKCSHQPKMNMWEFHQTIKNKFYTDETATRKSSRQPKMILWLFHLAIKKQNINK